MAGFLTYFEWCPYVRTKIDCLASKILCIKNGIKCTVATYHILIQDSSLIISKCMRSAMLLLYLAETIQYNFLMSSSENFLCHLNSINLTHSNDIKNLWRRHKGRMSKHQQLNTTYFCYIFLLMLYIFNLSTKCIPLITICYFCTRTYLRP